MPVTVWLSNTLATASFKVNYIGGYKPELEAELYNSVGQLVARFQVTESVDVSVEELAAGVYYCRLRSSGVPVLTEKVVKVR